MKRAAPPLADVVILRSGYASDGLWRAAIASALKHGRMVQAIDSEGRSVRHSPSDGPPDEPPDW